METLEVPMSHTRLLCVSLCAAALVLEACPTVRVPELMMAAGHTTAANPGSYPLKVHLRSGDLLVLYGWSDLPGDSGLSGRGSRYDVRRHRSGRSAAASRVTRSHCSR